MREKLSCIVRRAALLVLFFPTMIVAQETNVSRNVRQMPNGDSRHETMRQPWQAKAKTSHLSSNLTKLTRPADGARLAGTSPAAQAARRAPAIAPIESELRGAVIYSDSWSEGEVMTWQHGMYTVPTTTDGQFETIKVDPNLRATGGATLANGKYYSIELYSKNMGISYESRLNTFDATTWELENQLQLEDIIQCFDMTYDATTGYIYGSIVKYRTDENFFGIVNPQTGATTKIKDLPTANLWTAVMADPTGQIYAIDGGGTLLKVNKKTGEAVIVGNTGVKPLYVTGATIDPRTGRCFWSVCNESGGWLYELDLNTGAIVGSLNFPGNEEVAGLYFNSPLAAGDAPAAVNGARLEFAESSLSGELKFTAPTTTFDGYTATGQLDYKVLVNGIQTATGTTAFGAETTVPLTMEAAGDYDVAVCTSNAAGESPYVVVSRWIGSDAPVPVGQAAAYYSDGRMTISWTAVTEGGHDGHIDPAALTYEIVRYPGAVVVAEAATGTSFEEQLTEPDELTVFYYTVTPVHDGVRGLPTETNRCPLGVVVLPYSNGFASVEDFYAFSTIDVDNDGKGWGYDADWKTARAEYHSTNAKNDWLISPAFPAEAGKLYELRLSVAKTNSNSNLLENLEVYLGTSADVAGMTEMIVGNTVVTTPYYTDEGNKTGGQVVTVKFKATETGRRYIGVRACTAADSYDLHVLSFNLSAGIFAGSPSAPAAISTIPDRDGALGNTITFTAPSTDNDGNALTALTAIELLDADGNVLDRKDNPTPGSECSFVRMEAEAAYYTYGLRASNAVGQGETATFSAYAGVNVPTAPTSPTAVEDGNSGVVTIAWEAPTTDCDGRQINPDLVTYDVTELITETRSIVENHSGLSYTYQAASTLQPQVFAMYSIYARTSAGISTRRAMPEMLPVGAPYELPYVETFAGGYLWHILGVETVKGNGDWNVEEYGSHSADGDNCYLAMQGSKTGDCASVATGKISLEGVPAAMLSFSYYGTNGGASTIDVEVNSGNGFETEATFVTDAAQWQKARVDLTKYAGKTIRIRFVGTVVSNRSMAIDAIKIANAPDYDLAMTHISVPEKMVAGEAAEVKVVVSNAGRNAVSDYQVELTMCGEAVRTLPGTAIGPDDAAEFTFSVTPGIASPSQLSFSARVVYAADGNADNDITGVVYSTLAYSNTYPAPTALTASPDVLNVTLNWNEPAAGGGAPIAITDDFESYEPWTFDGVGGWTLTDCDNSQMGGLPGITLPEAVQGKVLPFFVFDSSYEALDGAYPAHSGNKQMGSMYVYDKTTFNFTVDDWMISPELYGTAQTISFYACSHAIYLETLEIYYSSTGTDVSDFTLLETCPNVPAEWTRYTCDLPEGAKYFAIRCTSNFCMMLGIDDVTYTPAGAELETLTLTGYNVYRDGTKLNDAPLTSCAYTDAVPSAGIYSYLVTAVYDKGESRPSEEAVAVVKGVDSGISGAVAGFSVKAADGAIVIAGAAGRRVDVLTLDDRRVFGGVVTDGARIGVTRGIYVVKAGETTMKITVR